MFAKLQQALLAHVSKYSKKDDHTWFRSKADKDALWNAYLSNFKPEDNPLFRERTEHDCNCCKQFIREAGGILFADKDGLDTISIWDFEVDEKYKAPLAAMAKVAKEAGIDSVYLSERATVGTLHNQDSIADIVWNHFFITVPSKCYVPEAEIATKSSLLRASKDSLSRALKEITQDSVNTVISLINDNNLYKGQEHLNKLTKFLSILKCSFWRNSEVFIWEAALLYPEITTIRNSLVGTLLLDLSKSLSLEDAVRKYESKAAPENYKRSKKLITEAMRKKALKRIQELGCNDSLYRRPAVMEDITVNNTLFADRTAKVTMGALDVLDAVISSKGSQRNPTDLLELSIEEFISDYLPHTTSMELLLENSHEKNLVSLVAPVHADAPNILKWDNNFSYSYNGDLTDSSISRNVVKAGGKVEGILRASLQWNDKVTNLNDLDIHCDVYKPSGRKRIAQIFFSNCKAFSGELDIDITDPEGVAVENIVFTDLNQMPDGTYEFYVNNYTNRNGRDWEAEVVLNGITYNKQYKGAMDPKQKEPIAVVRKTGDTLEMLTNLSGEGTPKHMWGISTCKYHKVDIVMQSPNFWDGNNCGNEHIFFMLENCKNPGDIRGIYNEFLSSELHEDRAVFEALGAQLKAPSTENQLSGVGFSTSQRAEVICRIKGEYNRNIKIKF